MSPGSRHGAPQDFSVFSDKKACWSRELEAHGGVPQAEVLNDAE